MTRCKPTIQPITPQPKPTKMKAETTKKQKAEPTRYTAFRCPVDLLQKAKQDARAQRRSLSNYILTLLESPKGSFKDIAETLRRGGFVAAADYLENRPF